jgi:hypothetical protein
MQPRKIPALQNRGQGTQNLKRDDLAIQDGSIRHVAQRLNDVWKSLVKDFPVPRVECHRASGFHRDRSVPSSLISQTQCDPSGNFATDKQSLGSIKAAFVLDNEGSASVGIWAARMQDGM